MGQNGDTKATESETGETGGQNGAGRDGKGRFAVGNPGGPGRPKGITRAIDLQRVAEDYAEKEGYDLKASLWRVVTGLIEAAEGGDVAAAKLVFERLCVDVVKLAPEVGVVTLDATNAARQIAGILAIAAGQMAQAEQVTSADYQEVDSGSD